MSELPPSSNPLMSRRLALKSGAVGLAAWSVPVAATVLLTPTSAQATSPVPGGNEPEKPRPVTPEKPVTPENPENPVTPGNPVTPENPAAPQGPPPVTSVEHPQPQVAAPPAAEAAAPVAARELAQTGPSVSTPVITGLALVATGAAAVAVSRRNAADDGGSHPTGS